MSRHRVRVWNRPTSWYRWTGHRWRTRPGKDGRCRANRLIEEATTVAEEKGRPVETGDPGDAILEFVADHDVDIVVVGGHGGERGDLARRLLVTVARATRLQNTYAVIV